jgi:hypothetical protein
MKVKDLIRKLQEYNQEAETYVIAHNKGYQFSITYGGSDGATKESCESVSFYVDDLDKPEYDFDWDKYL